MEAREKQGKKKQGSHEGGVLLVCGKRECVLLFILPFSFALDGLVGWEGEGSTMCSLND